MYTTHLQSALDPSVHFAKNELHTTHDGRPLTVQYDLQRIREQLSRDIFTGREQTMWRYRELLPPPEEAHIVTLAETRTPLIHCRTLGEQLHLPKLFVKDESRLPTGSFKSRGMAMAITMAKHLGVQRVAVPTAGNAGGALAAYAARARLECFIFMPDDTPIVNQLEAIMHGAHVFLVDGLISDCGRIVHDGQPHLQWFDMSTLKEPYRLEGKKTMGLELAEQLDWHLPDAIMYPTGGGTGLIGMWKAFNELRTLGWLPPEVEALPKMFCCQSDGCAPMVEAFDNNEQFATTAVNPQTIARGLRVPGAVGDFLILDAVRTSGGAALAAPEADLIPWMNRVAATEGIALCPEAAACFAVLQRTIDEGHLNPTARIVIFNTGAAQKYVEAMTPTPEDRPPRIADATNIDWDELITGR